MSDTDRFRLAKVPYHVKLVLLGMGGLPVGALAQSIEDSRGDEVDEVPLEEVIVTGVRGSLFSSQSLKQNSDVFVDAVTASDIVALPDRSVTEVLARIPGVSISRFAGVSDPDHFSVEGSGAVVRGLTFVRSELNGRDVFSADSGQALGFANVSPELTQSVQVFKNQSADLVEGGIGGTVNLVTRKPFDTGGQALAFSAESNYSDFREEWTPTVSTIWSNRWELDSGGEFGALIAAAYSELNSRADGTLVADWLDRAGTGEIIPSGAGIRTQAFDRERSGASAALQWASPDDTMEATFQFFHSAYDNAWNEHAIEPSIDDSPLITPRPGTSFSFGESRLFETGIISQQVGWRSSDPTLPLSGVRNLALVRERLEEPKTSEYSLNFKWAPTQRWRGQFDVQHVRSTVEVTDVTVHNSFFADMDLDMNGDVPHARYLPPTGEAEDYLSTGGAFYVRSIMDHLQDNEGGETAYRGDFEFDFPDDGWAESVRFGVRHAERDQTVRYSTYNWGNVSATWNSPWLLSSANAPAGLFQPYNFDRYHRGKTPGIDGVLFYAGEFTPDALRGLASLANNAWWVPLQDRAGVVPGTPFLPGEINIARQDTTAVYGRLNFGTEFGNGMTLDGNAGVRYVRTNQLAKGGINFPNIQQFLDGQANSLEERCAPRAPGASVPGFCEVDPATQTAYRAWADGSSQLIDDAYGYGNWLPSLNLKIGLNEETIIRLGISRAISRPDFGLLKSFFMIDFGGDDPVTGEWLGPAASTAEVRLDPIQADQIDLAYEWYFADIGSLTVTGFYKELNDYIVPSISVREFENSGHTFPVAVNGVGNSEETGKIAGFEIAYQQVYDTLPGMFANLGAQANYTFIDSDNVPNIGATNDSANGTSSAPNFDVSGLSLPGLSEDTVNFVVFWENDKVSARLAYNYRSEYTLTVRDVIFPFTPIVHENTGTLDGSFFYRWNDKLEFGVQAVNLTDEVTKTKAVYSADLATAARSFFRNDRRYVLVLRGNW